VSRRLLEPVIVRAYNDKVKRELRRVDADLIFVVKGRRLSTNTIRALRRRMETPIVNFYPDDPFSNVRSNRLTYGPSVLRAYDACFTFARHLIPKYREAGADQTYYLPFARDPTLHSPPDSSPDDPPYDIVFVGNLDATRVEWLEPLSDLQIAIYGEHTREAVPYFNPLREADFHPAAYGAGLAQALHQGAISLNIMREQNAGSHNMRSFESPACGAFTLSERTPELTDLFEEGNEIACFGTPEELRNQIGFWRANPDERREIAREGFRRVKDDTYRKRASRILDCVQTGKTQILEL
jgi:spore maturation protein CgeB